MVVYALDKVEDPEHQASIEDEVTASEAYRRIYPRFLSMLPENAEVDVSHHTSDSTPDSMTYRAEFDGYKVSATFTLGPMVRGTLKFRQDYSSM